MARGKRLTVEMKKFLSLEGLDYREWLYQENTTDHLKIVHKDDHKKTLIIKKG